MKINLLDSSVYNRIAAGEVVQQPSSVVKELLENSIDSGASEITIEISEGGIREIRIKDNGCGIAKDDIKNAFLPHATSKVKDIDDLDSISTLGFRGEALSSIASVSIVEARSKQAEDLVGSQIFVRGGDFSDVFECACTNGTDILVQNLFFNTPARAKFLKKPHQEESEVTTVVQKTIFANPNISFTYIIDGEIVYKTSGDGLLSAIYSVYGKDIYENAVQVSFNKRNVFVKGYICRPTVTKPNRNYQTIIANGRFIKDFSMSSVVANAYGDRLMKRNFPIFVLDVVVPFDEIDVNVHPAKTEVRFRKQSEVYGTVYTAVINALENDEKTLTLLAQKVDENIKEERESDKVSDAQEERISQPTVASWLKELLTDDKEPSSTLNESPYTPIQCKFIQNDDGSCEVKSVYNEVKSVYNETKPPIETKISETFSELRYDYVAIGQLFDCYLLLQHEDEFLIVDQHAAHERLLYDELIKKSGDYPTQPLLLPYVKTFSPQDYGRIIDISDSLKSLGIEIEEFGRYTIKISALPLPLVDMKIGEFLDGFLAETSIKTDFTYGDILKDKLAQRACKSAIKAGQSLNKTQIDTIVHQIIDSNMVLQCPHGRPIAIKYTKKEIEKLFKRLI